MVEEIVTRIVLPSPFDAHIHWRDIVGFPSMRDVAGYSMRQFSGGLLMPNTNPNITTLGILNKYRTEVEMVIYERMQSFHPLFVYYLSKDLSVSDLLEAWDKRLIAGVKWYPKGGTTNSSGGVEGYRDVENILTAMQEHGIPLLIHGEIPVFNDEVIDDDLREMMFLKTEMTALCDRFPNLRIVLEHITTMEAVDFVLSHDNVWATITPQHMLFDTRALFNGLKVSPEGKLKYDHSINGMQPHHMCRPIIKKFEHVMAIREVLIRQHKDGFKKFGLGTDSAPHSIEKKHASTCACGIFTAPIALELYAMAFEEMGILDHIKVFACDIMPEFYGIKEQLLNKDIILEREPQLVQPQYSGIITTCAELILPWRVNYN